MGPARGQERCVPVDTSVRQGLGLPAASWPQNGVHLLTWNRLRRLADLALGTERRQRVRVTRSLLAGCMCLVISAFFLYGLSVPEFGLNRTAVYALVAWMGLLVSGFYLFIRSGLNLRLAEPSAAAPQIVSAIITIAVCYALANSLRGATLMLVQLALLFGMFDLSPRQMQRLGWLTVTLLGCTMFGLWLWRPERYALEQEVVHFIVVATSVPGLMFLAGQITRLRQRLQSQKQELAQAVVRIQELATRDELTQLYNRRHMRELIAEHGKRVRRRAEVCSIALIDLDHFKEVNDTHGHGVGDETLAGFARRAQAALRETDVIGRWGGEEFLVLFPGTRLAQAEHALKRLRTCLQADGVSGTVPQLRVTFSAGVTEYGSEEDDDTVIERIDRALYEAKSAGRDRIEIHAQA